MISCARCGRGVVDGVRFCPACGANVLEARAPSQTNEAVDPLAATGIAEEKDMRAIRASVPMGERNMTAPLQAIPSQSPTSQLAPASPRPYAPPTPAPPPPMIPTLRVGSPVLVQWANGQRYPGSIHQLAGEQAFVVFPDGQQHWVGIRYVTLMGA